MSYDFRRKRQIYLNVEQRKVSKLFPRLVNEKLRPLIFIFRLHKIIIWQSNFDFLAAAAVFESLIM